MKKWLLLLLVSCSTAYAGDVTLDWTNPTDVEDCVAGAPYTNPGGTKIWKLVADITDPTITSFTLSNLLPGTYRYVETAYDTNGVSSRNSGEVVKEVTEFVTTAPNVYYVIAQPNSYVLLTVGSVPLGTPCNSDVSVNGKYAVDTTAVTWDGNVQPLAVVAQCG